jgi:Spy/CpxP family protein refolding chaperone
MRHSIVFMLALMAAGSAFAQKPNLTPEQKAQAKEIFAQARRDAQPLRQELKQNRQAMAQAVAAGKSESEIRQLATAQGNTLGQIIAIRSQARARFAAQLTPEQKAALGGKKGLLERRLARRKLR